MRTGFGAAVFAFLSVLFFGGSNDILARMADVPVIGLTNLLRVLGLALPVVVWLATYVICHQLQHVDRQRERKDHARRMAQMQEASKAAR